MHIQDNTVKSFDEPTAPDEGWWAAVLADESQVGESVDQIDLSENDYDNLNQDSTTMNWEKIEKIFNKDQIIELSVVGHNRGGVLVAGEDIHGFVPASHLVNLPPDLEDDDREDQLSSYMDRNIEVKVIECEREKERIVFSERAALAEEGQRNLLLQNLCEGDIVNGVVTNVTNFGAFVDLGGLEGLVHISELSWGRVKNPSEVLHVNDHIQTMVIQVSEEEGRIALSLKRLYENPWEILANVLYPGDVVEATISSIVKYGAFAEIECGVEGLIHISSMNFPENSQEITDFLYEGQSVLVRVLNIEPKKRRLGLQLESYQPIHGEPKK